MNTEQLFHDFQKGDLSLSELKEAIESQLDQLKRGSVEMDFATLDIHREQRIGFPEVIYGEGKSAAQIIQIIEQLKQHAAKILVTRINHEKAKEVCSQLPQVIYHEDARALTWVAHPDSPINPGYIAVVCAGTSDIPVAAEAAITAEMMGNEVVTIHDVGVAGIHRLFAKLDMLRNANVVIVVAGMEGALASVVGGLIDKPMIAVPTSVGYGSHFEGVAALLSMLNSCAPGVTVVNIDNGFGAGYAAGIINRSNQSR